MTPPPASGLPSIETLREAAKDLLHKNGWRPGDSLCLHSVTCLMAQLAYRAARQDYTCAYPSCGCCADAACPDADLGPETHDAQ